MTTGVRMVWDYFNSVWTTDTVNGGAAITSAVMCGRNLGTTPVYTCLEPDSGDICQESTTQYTDNGVWITSTVETAWIKGAGIAGLQMTPRAVLQAQSLTAHKLTLSIAYDYSDTYTDTQTWTDTEIAALLTARESLQIDYTRPECTAFRIKIEDVTPAGTLGTGQGAVLFGLQVEAGQNGGMLLLPEANKK